MLQFLQTWFGFGSVVDEKAKSGRVVQAEAQLYEEALLKNKPDDEKKTKRLKQTEWGTSRYLDLMWSKTNVSEPNDVKIIPGDKVVFADSGEEHLCVCELHDGTEIQVIKPASKLVAFKPKSLTLDEKNNIKVYDNKSNSVYTWQGKPNWRDLGKWNNVHRVFGDMRGMCTDHHREIIYIVDKSEGYISAHQTNGKRIRTFGRGKLKRPAFITCDRLGRIYVTDEEDCTVSVFDDMGNFIFKFGSQGENPGQLLGPTGICADQKGNIIVADSLNNRLCLFTPDGRFKHCLVSDSQIIQPLGIDLSKDGLLVIASQYISFKSVSVYKLC